LSNGGSRHQKQPPANVARRLRQVAVRVAGACAAAAATSSVIAASTASVLGGGTMAGEVHGWLLGSGFERRHDR
jgi:hypothetical protein